MTEAAVLAQIELLTKSSSYPTLSTAEVDYLVEKARRPDSSGLAPDLYAEWKAATPYLAGAKVVPITRNGFVYLALDAGTSGATEPTWPTESLETVVDNDLTWQNTEASNGWVPTYSIAYAVMLGWEMKASAIVTEYDFRSAGQEFSRSQLHAQLLKQAAIWRKRSSNVNIECSPQGAEYLYLLETAL